ncbi:hypothetical protein [Corynebacterium fournieri]|uniref:hypothetical protein n=1 Tax=Corynebacterium fournieri TaxID=1852390 RepID=UPI0015C47CE9|nr:hypothetical protein [Corynebacterium fournieri]
MITSPATNQPTTPASAVSSANAPREAVRILCKISSVTGTAPSMTTPSGPAGNSAITGTGVSFKYAYTSPISAQPTPSTVATNITVMRARRLSLRISAPFRRRSSQRR